MPACKSTKYTGKVVLVEYQIACGDTLPSPTGWKSLGAMRGKEMTLEWETVDATADDSVGAMRENLTTFQTFSISGDGTVKDVASGTANLTEITKHVANPVETGGTPVAWMRMTYPDLTFTAFMILTNMSRSAPYDDVVTYSMEASATASDFGLIVEDTPDPDADPVTAVTVLPTTASVAVGATTTLAPTVTPAGAAQTVQFSSALPSVASVNPTTGVVTGVSVGPAVITVTSVADPTKKATATITVTEAP